VLALERSSSTVPWTKPSSVGRYFDQQTAFGLIAPAGDLIAYALLSHREDGWWLDKMAVSHTCRRRGYGRQILDAVLSEISRVGGGHVRLHVRASNEAARRLYMAAGFVEEMHIKEHYRRGESTSDNTAIRMILRLHTVSDLSRGSS
jgi:ribosomal protein S18 acetylase RimI-like enzyme